MRKQYSPTFKAKVVLEMLREDKTLNEAAATHGVHMNQLRRWRQQEDKVYPYLLRNITASYTNHILICRR